MKIRHVAMVAVAVLFPAVVHAQISASYSFEVPVAKVVPTPCSTGFELVTGTLRFAIRTTDSGASGYTIAADVTSSGTGQDALSTGTLILDTTRKPDYTYTYTSGFDASFLRKPATFGITTGLVDWLTRGDGYTDSFVMRTEFDVNFSNGVPTVPVLKDITVTCQ